MNSYNMYVNLLRVVIAVYNMKTQLFHVSSRDIYRGLG